MSAFYMMCLLAIGGTAVSTAIFIASFVYWEQWKPYQTAAWWGMIVSVICGWKWVFLTQHIFESTPDWFYIPIMVAAMLGLGFMLDTPKVMKSTPVVNRSKK